MAAKEIERLRKITLGTIKVQPDIEILMKAPGKKMDLCDLFGIATRVRPGSSQHGPFVAFVGTFRALRLEDKVEFESNKIILPGFIEEELFAAFNGEASANVEFAMRISAKFDKDAATKYVYDMVPLIKPKENAQLNDLLGRVKEAAKALPAPKT